VQDEAVTKRLRGELPRIGIDGDTFIVDWRLKELRSVDDLSRIIHLSKMDMNRAGTEYVVLYDRDKKQVHYEVTEEMAVNKGMHVLRIPHELKLDPVAVARQYGLGDTELLKKFPIQEKLAARVERLDEFQKRENKQAEKSKLIQRKENKNRKGLRP